jgi:hypothetical protein
MIQVPPNATIVVMHDAINFRAGIDGTAAIARLVLEKDPMNGALFVISDNYFDGAVTTMTVTS